MRWIFSDGRWRPYLKEKTQDIPSRMVTVVLVCALGFPAAGMIAAWVRLWLFLHR